MYVYIYIYREIYIYIHIYIYICIRHRVEYVREKGAESRTGGTYMRRAGELLGLQYFPV